MTCTGHLNLSFAAAGAATYQWKGIVCIDAQLPCDGYCRDHARREAILCVMLVAELQWFQQQVVQVFRRLYAAEEGLL